MRFLGLFERTQGMRILGRVELVLRGEDGQEKARRIVDNLVVNTGLYHVADQLSDQGESAMSHMAVGSDNTAAAAGQTALLSELGRVALTSTTQGAGASANQVTYVATLPAGTGTGALVEAGIFNDASVGEMLCRTVFSVVNKGTGDSLTITWVLTISAA